jgi:hypothetical protein
MATPFTMSPQQSQSLNPNINAWNLALQSQYPLLSFDDPQKKSASRGGSQNQNMVSNLFQQGGPSGTGMPAYNTFGAVDATGSGEIGMGASDAAASYSGAAGGEAATSFGGAGGAGALGGAAMMGIPLALIAAVLGGSAYTNKAANREQNNKGKNYEEGINSLFASNPSLLEGLKAGDSSSIDLLAANPFVNSSYIQSTFENQMKQYGISPEVTAAVQKKLSYSTPSTEPTVVAGSDTDR